MFVYRWLQLTVLFAFFLGQTASTTGNHRGKTSENTVLEPRFDILLVRSLACDLGCLLVQLNQYSLETKERHNSDGVGFAGDW